MPAKIIIWNPGRQEINFLSPLDLCKTVVYQDELHFLYSWIPYNSRFGLDVKELTPFDENYLCWLKAKKVQDVHVGIESRS